MSEFPAALVAALSWADGPGWRGQGWWRQELRQESRRESRQELRQEWPGRAGGGQGRTSRPAPAGRSHNQQLPAGPNPN